MEGIKCDDGHPRVGLVFGDFALALRAVAEVGTFGAHKYAAHNWLKLNDGQARYTDAMLRHYLAERTDSAELDTESGYLHAAHLAWNALARLELILRKQARVSVQCPQPNEDSASSVSKAISGLTTTYRVPAGVTDFDNLGPAEVDIAMRGRTRSGLSGCTATEWDAASSAAIKKRGPPC